MMAFVQEKQFFYPITGGINLALLMVVAEK